MKASTATALLATLLATLLAAVAAASPVGAALAAGPDPAAASPAPPPGHPALPLPDGRYLPAAYVVVDAGTGAVLAARNEHEPRLPASTQKLMTALVAVQALDARGTLTVSPRAAAQPAMRIGMKAGEVWPVADALRCLLIISANDAAYALAEAAAGSVEEFSNAMNSAARRLGMTDSTFRDPAGLDGPEGVGGGSAVSAFDLAVLARNVLAVPEIAGAARTAEYRFTGPDGVPHELLNHNRRFLDGYPGAFGLKPGYTSRALETLVAVARRDGRTLIVALTGAGGAPRWAAALLDLGFATAPGSRGTGAVLPAVRVDASGHFAAPKSGTTARDPAAAAARKAVAPSHRSGAATTRVASAEPSGSWPVAVLSVGGVALGAGAALVAGGEISRRRRRR